MKLSIDLRVQHALRDELAQGHGEISRQGGAGAVVSNVKTGEIVAMASVPDFDPNNPHKAHDKDRLNRLTTGVYEMGSTFKGFTLGDGARFRQSDDVRAASMPRVRSEYGHSAIHDFHGKDRVLSLPEVFIYSSNVGVGRGCAELVGIEAHKANSCSNLGMFDRMQTELPEVARPTEPKVWKQVNSFTIAFGHGVSTTPLQAAVGCAALMNGGYLIPPTFLVAQRAGCDGDGQAGGQATRPSRSMRYLMRLNAEKGIGQKRQTSRAITSAARPAPRKRSSMAATPRTLLSIPSSPPSRWTIRNTWCLPLPTSRSPEKPGMTTSRPECGAVIAGNIISRVRRRMLGVEPDFGHENGARWFPISEFSGARRQLRSYLCCGERDSMKLKDSSRYPASRRHSFHRPGGYRHLGRTSAPGETGRCLSSRSPAPRRTARPIAGDAGRARCASRSLQARAVPLPGFRFQCWHVDDPRRALALMRPRFFRRQPETIVAVTGTSGKTSVAAFTRQIWEQAGHAAASIGTIGVVAPGRNVYGSLTTPDPVALHQLLDELAGRRRHASRDGGLVSHGLDQRRLDGVRIAAGGFTNLGRDHLDYHPTSRTISRAKLRLFDDAAAERRAGRDLRRRSDGRRRAIAAAQAAAA